MRNISTFKKLLLGCLLCWSVAQVQAQISPNPSVKNFTWYTNNHFKLSKANGSYKIEMDKMPWEAFTLFLDEVDLSSLPVLKFKIKSDAAIDLRLDMIDYTGALNIATPLVKSVDIKDSFVELKYDFSNIQKGIDATRISHLLFYVAPGEKHQGTIEIKEILFEASEGNHTGMEVENVVAVASNFDKKEVTIKSSHQQFDQVNIYNNLGQLVLSQKILPTLAQRINIEKLEQGIFFLEVRQQGDIFFIGSISR